MVEGWSGTLFFARDWAMYRGPVWPTSMHSHHAHQVVLASPPLEIRDVHGSAAHSRSPLVIPGGDRHMIASAHAQAIILFFERSGGGPRLSALSSTNADATTWEMRGEILGPLGSQIMASPPRSASEARLVVRDLREAAGWRPASSNGGHPAIVTALDAIEGILPGSVRASDVAAAVGLSASRLMHLFRDELDISLKGRVRWARMRRALIAMQGGASIGRAAHGAGFADAAHLTRTFRSTFGFTPSALVRSVEWVRVDSF